MHVSSEGGCGRHAAEGWRNPLRRLFAHMVLLLSFSSAFAQTGNIQSFNVRTFGAKGDGAQDDCSAIQRAINAAQAVSGTVYVPTAKPKYYLCNSAGLAVTSAIRIVGDQIGGSE